MQPYSGNTTHIKFGGWDQDGILVGQTLKMIKTTSNQDWLLKFDTMKVDEYDVDLEKGSIAKIDLDTPFIFVPQ